jgi:phage baseplate assembly protein W
MPSRVPQYTRNIKQRVVYKDFTPNLTLLPITGELLILKNDQAVAQSIRNLVLTYNGERYYNQQVGSTVSRDLFEMVDDFTLDRIKNSIISTINNFEQRAINVVVNVEGKPTDNFVNVTIQFGISIQPGQSFSVPTIVLQVRG